MCEGKVEKSVSQLKAILDGFELQGMRAAVQLLNSYSSLSGINKVFELGEI